MLQHLASRDVQSSLAEELEELTLYLPEELGKMECCLILEVRSERIV